MRYLFTTATLLLCLAFASTASAATIVAIDDRNTAGIDLVLNDDDADGIITTGGFISVGGVPLNLTLGIGNTAASRLDLQTIAASFEEGAALDVLLTQTDYTGGGLALSQIAGSTGGNVVYASYFDLSNTPFGFANLIGGPLSFSDSAFADSTIGFIPGSGPFSLTQAISITHAGGQALTQVTASVQVTPVPEPATMSLLGLGLSSVALSKWRRSRAKA